MGFLRFKSYFTYYNEFVIKTECIDLLHTRAIVDENKKRRRMRDAPIDNDVL